MTKKTYKIAGQILFCNGGLRTLGRGFDIECLEGVFTLKVRLGVNIILVAMGGGFG